MDEPSLMLPTKLFLLLTLFLLHQLDSGSKCVSLIHNPYDGSNFNGGPYSGGAVSVSYGLPYAEVNALSSVIRHLGLSPAPYISSSFCDDDPSLLFITIRCAYFDSLPHITYIDMRSVHLSGYIHSDVTKLRYLQSLDLSNNKLQGEIPYNIGDLSLLTWLDLSLNFLSGSIPQSLGDLSSLTTLNLWSNRLSGEIPRELGKLSKLERLRLYENELNGTLPPELGKLSNLRLFYLTSNNLTGKLPDGYSELKSLRTFDIGGNYLKDRIPEYIASWVNLTQLSLIGNNFEGEIPAAIFNMSKLEYLMVSDLSNNGFKFPNSANLSNIFTLTLRNCNIIGEIPPYIGNWNASLKNLDLSFNKLTGGIPPPFEHLTLYRMLLTGNALNETIPDWINQRVTFMGDISYNNFSVGEPGNKHKDVLYNNSKDETFPDPKINYEPKNRKSLYDTMDKRCPDKKSKYHFLFINAGGEDTTIEGNHYDADNTTNNSLYENPANHWAYSCSGDFQAKTVNSSDYLKNLTCGAFVPEAPLYEKARLCPQSLRYFGFCLHNGNYTVKLHFAEILFTEDEDHSSSGKRVFDVYIQGKQVLKDFNIKEKAGSPNKIWTENFTAVNVHDHLLEIHLFWAGKGSIFNPPALSGPLISAISVTSEFKVGGLSTKEIAGIVIAAVLAPLLLLGFIWRMGWLGDRELRVATVNLRGKSYTLKQVKDATRNFSTKNKIGKGRFGVVYKAELPDHQIVAVKKLSIQSKVDEVRTEVYALKQLKHDNIVELLDIHSKRDLHLLIYEYMERGSLKGAFFDDSDSKLNLDWESRVKICLGIAKGLEYLHANQSGAIVHRNVKASNILLDENLNAKVSDLGLAKLYDEENPYNFIKEIGTVVYMAPEYATRQDVTVKADVYSYGILLIEIVSGKSNSKRDENQENDYILNKACVLHSEKRHLELVDENLSNQYDRQQAVKILDLAMKCLNLAPALRPTMSEVVNELEQISKLNNTGSA